ncbi:hypothetical protein B0H11DRAFT_2369150 [Mycena galericulata]|nr:hypothetical protein B0H11DRAFT_2264887 [Mycena galericulata]KAJ7435054.1 hypothetical protein B0H11DRAFT_2369150 [Mycena galericulata]
MASTSASRLRFNSIWPLFEMRRDATKEPMQIVDAYLAPIMKKAAAAVHENEGRKGSKVKAEEVETLLDELLNLTSGSQQNTHNAQNNSLRTRLPCPIDAAAAPSPPPIPPPVIAFIPPPAIAFIPSLIAPIFIPSPIPSSQTHPCRTGSGRPTRAAHGSLYSIFHTHPIDIIGPPPHLAQCRQAERCPGLDVLVDYRLCIEFEFRCGCEFECECGGKW